MFHWGAPAGSVQDLYAWSGETGVPRGYEAIASFLFPLLHPIPLAGSQVQAPARTKHSQDGQRGGACDATQIPAPWGLNLPGSARALQQVLLVHGRHAASPTVRPRSSAPDDGSVHSPSARVPPLRPAPARFIPGPHHPV